MFTLRSNTAANPQGTAACIFYPGFNATGSIAYAKATSDYPNDTLALLIVMNIALTMNDYVLIILVSIIPGNLIIKLFLLIFINLV